jgi:hypothetical protein
LRIRYNRMALSKRPSANQVFAMEEAKVKTLSRYLLAAWMLLATSATPSTYVHAHSNGNTAHQHDGHGGVPADRSTPADSYGNDATAVNSSAEDTHRHGCLTLLGTFTCHSIPDQLSGFHEKKPCGCDTIVAVSAAQTIRAPLKNLWGSSYGCASAAVLVTGCVCERKQLDSFCTGCEPVSPLCDRARHERSGVLLA